MRVVIVFGAWLLAVASRADDGSQSLVDSLRQPGMRAEYLQAVEPARSAPAKTPSLVRQEFAPALLLRPGEGPDSRLRASGWKVRYKGVIEVLKPGRYRFSARSSGPLTLRIAGRAVIGYLPRFAAQAPPSIDADARPDVATVAGQSIELGFGLHPLTVDFEPHGDGAELKLYWESEHFARETITSRVVGHAVPAEAMEAASGVPISPGALLSGDAYLAGRLAVEEHGCVACHRPSDAAPISHGLVTRPGPRLSGAGDRLKFAWIYHWLGDPQAIRPEAVMPRLFETTRTGQVERYAVATYLASLTAPGAEPAPVPVENEATRAQLSAQGKTLFERTGCIACHRATGDRPAQATLLGLDQKTSAESLAKYLQNPAAFAPSGRMPNMALSAEESRELAYYLTDPQTAPIAALETPAPPSDEEIRQALLVAGRDNATGSLPADAPRQRQLSELGRQVLHGRRCTACHEMNIAGEEQFWRARPAETDFATIAERGAQEPVAAGCLAAEPATGHPVYAPTLSRAHVHEFLAAAVKAPGTTAPPEAARLALFRFNCLACHERDGVGGLAPEFVRSLAANQSAEEAELIKPPTLTGITDKLLGPAVEAVLTGDARARPWMSVRMPHFGKEHVGQLAAGLAALDAAVPAEGSAAPAPNSELAEAGRQLVGAAGFGCTKCHDMLDRKSGGTRGPDLARVPQRIQRDWFSQWMTDPQRIEPGTRMPTVFLQGESPHQNVLDGDPVRQREAIWQYLAASRDLPLPAGLEPVASRLTVENDRVLVARTFLPEVSPRSMAIRYPAGLHLAFDAQSCRLAYAWRGEFLDMTPVWTDRGGQPAGIRAPIRWRSPGGFPWDVAAVSAEGVASFGGRATDPSWGAPLPDDAQLHPSRVHFRGYRVDRTSATFRYDLELSDGRQASFSEQLTAAADDSRGQVVRAFALATPEPARLTLNVADLAQPPTQTTPGKNSTDAVGANDQAPIYLPIATILLTAEEGGAAAYRVRSAAADARWCIAPRDGRWSLLLQFSTTSSGEPQRPADSTDTPARAQATVEVLMPAENTPQAVTRLIESLQRDTEQ